AETKWSFNPTRRGGGGLLKTLWWQAPTLLNPHFATGTKDQDASRIFYEPLGSYDPDGNLVPMLAAEVPSLQNGQVAKDGTSVTWRLKKNVVWHDGKPFTADDVIFNWEYVMDPATAATTQGSYRDIERIDTLDSHTVKIVFKKPTPFWAAPFCGTEMIIPKHLFQAYKGDKSREAPTDPWTEVDGERSSMKTAHPFLTDPAVRQALNLLVDRGSVQDQIYGRTGIATANFLNAPSRFVSTNTRWEFSVDRANAILDGA